MCVFRRNLGCLAKRTECPSYEKDFPLNSALGFALSKDLRYVVCVFRRYLGCLAKRTLPLTCSGTGTVQNVRPTRKSMISRVTRLRLLHYPKTCGMSCASYVEMKNVSHKAPFRLHVPNSNGMECASYKKV